MYIGRQLHIFPFQFFLILCLFNTAVAQHPTAIDTLLLKAKEQVDAFDEKKAIETYQQVLEVDPDNLEALWNISLLHSTVGHRFKNKEKQYEYYVKALNYAEETVKNYPYEGLAWYVRAVAKGRISELKGTREKIKLSHEIQEDIKKAVNLLPNHALSWHFYGVWQSRVANVGRAERFAAKFISGGIPDASNKKAEGYLERAIHLNPNNVLIRFDLAKHYVRSGQKERAIPVLEKLITIEPQLKDGKRHIDEARKLLNDLKS